MSGTLTFGLAQEFLTQHTGNVVLTDPPHLDTFLDTKEQHSAFVESWLLPALKAAPVVIHTCGQTADEVKAYDDVKRADEILLWKHAAGHHHLLIYGARWKGARVLDGWTKPHALWELLLSVYARPGATVLDPFCGRGEIPAAAIRLGLDVLACDNVLSQVDATAARLREYAVEV